MRPGKLTWYSAVFDSTPDLAALSLMRGLLGPNIPMFFRRGEGFSVILYLPPEAARAGIRRDPRFGPFDPCEKPPDDGRLRLLFGDEEDAARYFQSFLSNDIARSRRG